MTAYLKGVEIMRKVTTFATLMLAVAGVTVAEAQVRDRRVAAQRIPAINQVAYGPDQCLYRFTGRGWSPLGLCHRWVRSNMAYLMIAGRPGVIHSVLHYAGGRLIRRDDLTSRQEIWFNPDGTVKRTRPMTAASGPIGPPPIEAVGTFQRGTPGVQTRRDCPTPSGYFAVGDPCWSVEQAMQREAQRRAAQARGAFTIPIVPRASTMDPRAQQIWTQGQIDATGILLRPPCTASYNGC